MQNIQISISFHSTTHNHENTKHMQTEKLKTWVNITDFWNKSWDSICVWLLDLISNDRVHMFGTEPVILQRTSKQHHIQK